MHNAQSTLRGSRRAAVTAVSAIVLAFAATGHAAPRAKPVSAKHAHTAPTPDAPQSHFEIVAQAITAGSPVRSQSACFGMTAAIAQPVAGTSWSAHFVLKGGIMAPRATQRDAIFLNSFEDCAP